MANSVQLRALFKKVLSTDTGSAAVTDDILKERVIDPLEKVLPRELRDPWSQLLKNKPAAVGEMINGLLKVQEYRPEFGIDAL